MDTEQLRLAATARIQRRRDFASHLAAYLLVMTMLVGIWATTGHGYFWPVWPMLFSGIGLSFQHFNAIRNAVSDDDVACEMARLSGQS